MRIVVTFDNTVAVDGLQEGWGFSCWVETEDGVVLFDTGSHGDTLLANMEMLGLSPKRIQAIALSHFHWDHTGGLLELLEEREGAPVFMHRGFSPRFAKEVARIGGEPCWVENEIELMPNVHITAPVSGVVPESALVVKGDRGLLMITGCAHPGVVRMAEYVKKTFGEAPVAVMGGFHLLDHSETEVRRVMERLYALGVREAGPTHCTGDAAIALFRSQWPGEFLPLGVGREIVF